MERYRKGAVIALLFFFGISFMVMLSEIPMIPSDERNLYIVTKILAFSMALPLAYWLHKDIGSQTANTLVGIMFMLYPMQGQFFRPLYYYALLQLMALYSFVFPVSKMRFRIVVSLGALGFLFILRMRWDIFLEDHPHSQPSDLFFAVLGVVAISWISNTYFTSERTAHEEHIRRFGQIGIQTARVVHDLKGLISAPKLYLQLLENRLNLSKDDEATKAMDFLSRDLESLKDTLVELNQLCKVHRPASESFEIQEVVTSLKVLLKNHLHGVDFEASGNFSIHAPKSICTSMLMNLVLNSAQALKDRAPSKPMIQLMADGNSLTIQDNAGGFPADILEAIARNEFISTRAKGSGLGLLFVFDEMAKLRGKVQLSNTSTGACVRLVFPSHLIKRNSEISQTSMS